MERSPQNSLELLPNSSRSVASEMRVGGVEPGTASKGGGFGGMKEDEGRVR